LNFYKHHIGDYAKKTGALSMTEHGAYLLMLQAYYGTEKPLPFGRDLYRICRAFGKKERAAVDKVAALFWKRTEAGFVNGRAFEEIEIASELSDIARENGSKGGRPKKPSGLIYENPAGSEKEPNAKAIQTPDSRLQTPYSEKDTRLRGPPASRSTACRLPENFDLSEVRKGYAAAQGIDPERTFENFRDYWTAASGAKARKHDWDATWRMWCRNQTERQPMGRKVSRAKSVAQLEAEEREQQRQTTI
jgi:uncharacterized protein YdaU (DUF1376 family)